MLSGNESQGAQANAAWKLFSEPKKPTVKKDLPPKVFVGNLPVDVERSIVQSKFEMFGNVKFFHLVTNRPQFKDRRRVICALVQFENSADGEMAIDALDKTELEGNVIDVRWQESSTRNIGRKVVLMVILIKSKGVT